MTFGGKKLNKTDRKHLRENKIFTKYQFVEQIAFQKKEFDAFHKNEPSVVCWDCLRIAKKLGMWD